MITPCVPTQAKQDFWDGVHQPGDTYKAALFTSDAKLGPSYAVYTPRGETSGQGYTPGGQVLTGRTSGQAGTLGYIGFGDPAWPNSTITARALVIYNATRENRVIVILDFGREFGDTNGVFSPTLPARVAVIQ